VGATGGPCCTLSPRLRVRGRRGWGARAGLVARTPALASEVVLRSSLLWRRVQTASDVRSQCAEIVAIAAATTATQRWTGGACGRRFGSVQGRGRHGVVVSAPKSSPSPPPPPPLKGGRAARAVDNSVRCRGAAGIGSSSFAASAPKSSPSPPPPPPLKGGQAARAVDGSDRCGGAAGIGSSSFAASAPKSSPSPPPPPPLKGGRAARAVDGSDRCGGAAGMGSSLSSSAGLVLGHHGHRVAKGPGQNRGRAFEGPQPFGAESEGETVRHCNPARSRPCARPIGLHKGDRPKRLCDNPGGAATRGLEPEWREQAMAAMSPRVVSLLVALRDHGGRCWRQGALFLRVLLKSEVLRAAGDVSALSRVWVD
jgi:hypothetical protein